MLTTREKIKTTRPCGGSLQTATTSGSTTRGAQTMERPHCCPAARALPPSARAVCRLIAATAPSSFPARLKGGTSTCGSTPSDSRNVRTCGKGESSEREGSGAGVASVQVCCSFTRQHSLCLATRLHGLVLSHAVSSIAILRDRRRWRQSANHPDDSTFDLCDLDYDTDNAPERGFDERRPW